MEFVKLPLDEVLIALGNRTHNTGVIDEKPKSLPVIPHIDLTEISYDFPRIGELSHLIFGTAVVSQGCKSYRIPSLYLLGKTNGGYS